MNANVVVVGPLRTTQHDPELVIPIKTWSSILSLVARHSGPRIEPQSVTNFSVLEANRLAVALRKGLAWLDTADVPKSASLRGSAQFLSNPQVKAREALSFLAGAARGDVERVISLCDESRGLRATQRYKDTSQQMIRGQAERGNGRAMRAVPIERAHVPAESAT